MLGDVVRLGVSIAGQMEQWAIIQGYLARLAGAVEHQPHALAGIQVRRAIEAPRQSYWAAKIGAQRGAPIAGPAAFAARGRTVLGRGVRGADAVDGAAIPRASQSNHVGLGHRLPAGA
jgi:hypothetical protein